MNMNFSLAFEKLNVDVPNRRTIFRYDDTNPAKESVEYITSLANDLAWMGWKPERTTYSSESFDQLFALAQQLIQKGLAYVCFLSKAEVEVQRELCKRRAAVRSRGGDVDKECPIPSPDVYPGKYRNTSVEDNLRLFNDMKNGKFKEGECSLRMKMDLESANPNMHDLVAYRIKYVPHPHLSAHAKEGATANWCIYPSYDYTHCIIDSLEHIDYSICTLEFETRREPYFWLLWALDLYRPKVYEMSRLNIAYTVLSKRRLLKLVENNYVRGWDDPRMPTIAGLRRRGYTATCLNAFCNEIGATRNMNVVEVSRLEQQARVALADDARRCMAVLNPVEVAISGIAGAATIKVPNFPQAPEKGEHDVEFSGSSIFVDRSDFKEEADSNFFGISPGRLVGLKYANAKIMLKDVVKDAAGVVTRLNCEAVVNDEKPKSYITWVNGTGGLKVEVRQYSTLFSVAEPSDKWEEELNLQSEVVMTEAMVDASVSELCDASACDKWKSGAAFQFERIGYYVVDYDTTYNSKDGSGKIVFNSIVGLREDVAKKDTAEKKEGGGGGGSADEIRAKQAKQKARLAIPLVEFFVKCEEYKGMFSKFDDKGIPTHDKDGEEMKKSVLKKLMKDHAKHDKALQSAAKQAAAKK
jgi:glutaminyl-tRNA synthetase